MFKLIAPATGAHTVSVAESGGSRKREEILVQNTLHLTRTRLKLLLEHSFDLADFLFNFASSVFDFPFGF